MRMTKKAKRILTTVLSVVLGLGAVLGVGVAVKHYANKEDDGLVKVKPKFEIGGLTEYGKYVEDNGSLYTKEAFECQGLKITLDFEDTINYKVFFYKDNGDFISATEDLGDSSTPVLPTNATHARIEITPDWETLDITKEKEQVIKWYEKNKYASQMEIKVNEEQLSYIEILTSGDDVYTLMGQGMFDVTDDSFSSNTNCSWYFSGFIDCSSATQIIIKLETTELTRKILYMDEERYAINMYDLTNDIALTYEGNPNIIAVEGKFSYISVDCSNFDSFIFSTSVNVLETVEVYLI